MKQDCLYTGLRDPLVARRAPLHIGFESFKALKNVSVKFFYELGDLGPVYMRKNTSPARPGAER